MRRRVARPWSCYPGSDPDYVSWGHFPVGRMEVVCTRHTASRPDRVRAVLQGMASVARPVSGLCGKRFRPVLLKVRQHQLSVTPPERTKFLNLAPVRGKFPAVLDRSPLDRPRSGLRGTEDLRIRRNFVLFGVRSVEFVGQSHAERPRTQRESQFRTPKTAQIEKRPQSAADAQRVLLFVVANNNLHHYPPQASTSAHLSRACAERLGHLL